MTIPASFIYNETPTWLDDSFTDSVTGVVYTSATHTLIYVMAGPIASPVTLTATANGLGWTTTLGVVNSALMLAGLYGWQAVVSAAGFRKVKATGNLVVLPDLALAGANYDARTNYEKALDIWKAALTAVTSSPVREYQIGNRRMSYRDLKEITGMIQFLTAQVATEKASTSAGKSRNLLVRFNRAS